jgi:hypothetical protein
MILVTLVHVASNVEPYIFQELSVWVIRDHRLGPKKKIQPGSESDSIVHHHTFLAPLSAVTMLGRAPPAPNSKTALFLYSSTFESRYEAKANEAFHLAKKVLLAVNVEQYKKSTHRKWPHRGWDPTNLMLISFQSDGF